MAHKKTKYDIKSQLFLKDGLSEHADWWYYWDDDDDWDYHDDYCDCYLCISVDYEYLPDELQPIPNEYISKRGRVTIEKFTVGKLIDMTSIYSKQELRQRKLDAIFGGKYNIFDTKTYLEDLLNEKDKNILRKLDSK